MSLFVFKIDGMHCASCSTRLEKTLIQNDKIDAANVNLSTEKAYVRSQNLTAEQIIKIVAETGFSASVFDNQQNLQNKQNNEKQI
ncbi:MAG: cation transporter, partial [Rhodocyclaceae bacterium]